MGHAENKRARLEQVELLLQSTTTGLTKQDIARRLKVNTSTIHRDFDEIARRCTLIEVSHGHYRLDPNEYLTNVRLYPTEAMSIYLAMRRFIRQTSHAPEFMLSAIRKVANALLRPELTEALVTSTALLGEARPTDEKQRDIWETLIRAWLDRQVVRIRYQKPREKAASEHEFEPYLFEPMVFGHGTYVIGWSRTRNELRTLKVDRVQRVILTTEYFERPTLNIDELLRHAWGVWYGVAPTRVELLFVPEVAPRVLETVFHPTEYKVLQADGSLYWSVEVAGTLEVLSWVRGWGAEVTVIAPQALRQEVITDLRKTLARYEEA